MRNTPPVLCSIVRTEKIIPEGIRKSLHVQQSTTILVYSAKCEIRFQTRKKIKLGTFTSVHFVRYSRCWCQYNNFQRQDECEQMWRFREKFQQTQLAWKNIVHASCVCKVRRWNADEMMLQTNKFRYKKSRTLSLRSDIEP